MFNNVKLFALAANLTLATLSVSTFAVPVTTVISGNLSYSENGTSSGSSVSPASNVYSWEGSPTLDSYAEITGDSSGTTEALSWSHAESAQVVSQIYQKSTVLNNTGSAQRFAFHFLVDSGSISATANNPMMTGEYLDATYNMNILVNGKKIWESTADLFLDQNGYVLTKSGTDLNKGAVAGPNYTWADYTGRLSLGTFQDNESFTLEYYLTATVTNSFYVYENQSCDENSVPLPGTNANCSQPFNGQSYARIGDPNGFEHSPINSDTVIPASNLPEPAGLMLIGLGLAALGLQRKRA